MTDFEQNEQNPLDDHDFFIENTIEEESGSNILKIAILVLVALGLLIGGYLLFFSGDDEKITTPTETTEMTTDTENVDDTTKAMENAAVDPNAEVSGTQTDTQTESGTENASDTTEATNTTDNKTSTATSDKNTSSSVENNNNTTNTDLHYFVIRGAFSEEANAQKSVDGLKTVGYNAVIVGKNKAGLFMVAYEGFATIGEAKIKLAEVRNTQGDAWIYKK